MNKIKNFLQKSVWNKVLFVLMVGFLLFVAIVVFHMVGIQIGKVIYNLLVV